MIQSRLGPMRSGLQRVVLGFLLAIAAAPLFAQTADLGILKTGPNTATAGSNVTFSITATNAGPDDASGAVINDAVPSGMTFVSASQTSGPTFVCTGGATVTCNIATFPSGTTATFDFVFNIPNGTPDGTFFFNTATIGSDTPDDNSENNSSVWGVSTPLPPMADLSITKTGPSAAPPDSDVTYTIVVTNPSSNAANNVTWQDTLPVGVPGGAQMTFVSFNQTGGPPTPPCTTGTTINCDVGTVPANTSITYALVGHVPPGTPAGTTFTNTATLNSTNDPNSENNTSSTAFSVSAVDVSVVKSGPATVLAGNSLTYTITVANSGPDAATNVNLTDAVPPGTTFVSILQNSGPAALCSGGTLVTCNIPILGPAATAQFALTLTAGNVATVTNTANVTTDSFDTDTNNNSSSVSTAVIPQADLVLTKSAPASAVAGNNITYTLTVTNNGPSDATSVTLNDVLPPNTTFVSFTAPPGWAATTPAVGANGAVTATTATLAAGSTANFTLVVQTNPGTLGGSSISNTATVASGTGDPNPGNNSSPATTSITAQADLSMAKSGTGPVLAGGNITYTLTVTNNGPSDASLVSLTDVLPPNTTFVSLTAPAGWTTTAPPAGSTGTVTALNGILTPGATANFTLVVQVNAATPAGTSISNTATVTSTTPDGATGNNSATATTTVATSMSDLSVTKSATPASPIYPVGFNITFTIQAANAGPNTANGVTVTDTLPANMTFVSASSTQGTCSGTTTVTCSVGTLATGGNATITIVARTASVGSSTNTATITSSSSDTNTANNTASVTFAVSADIPTLSPLLLVLLAAALAAIAIVRS